MSENSEPRSEQFEAIKRQAGDVVDDMKTRKLLLPAIFLVVAIVAAIVVLPKPTQAPSSDASLPAAPQTSQGPKAADQVAAVSVVDIGETPSGQALADTANPFKQNGSYTCRTVQERDPKTLECDIAGLDVMVFCTGAQLGQPPCTPAAGSTASTGGSTSSTGETGGSTNSTGLPVDPGGGKSIPIYVYKVNVVFDGKTYKNVEQGEELPSKNDPIVGFVGVSESGNRAAFKAPEGSTVTGVTVDKSGLVWGMKKGQTAKITDASGEPHTLKLTSISKVKA